MKDEDSADENRMQKKKQAGAEKGDRELLLFDFNGGDREF